MDNNFQKKRAICAGCKYFTIRNGSSHPYTCKLWGVSSATYNVAQVVYVSIGKKCPYCNTTPRNKEKKDDKIKIPHNGKIDIVI